MTPEAYLYRALRPEEVPTVFQWIKDRIVWMDEHRLPAWNTHDYLNSYPLSYYAQQQANGTMYALEDRKTHQIVCAAVLFETDPRWPDNTPAYYIHNFVSALGYSGIGAVFLRYVEQATAAQGKAYIRLDSAQNNPKLAAYYEAQGYLPVGTCQDGIYAGTLRQKAAK